MLWVGLLIIIPASLTYRSHYALCFIFHLILAVSHGGTSRHHQIKYTVTIESSNKSYLYHFSPYSPAANLSHPPFSEILQFPGFLRFLWWSIRPSAEDVLHGRPFPFPPSMLLRSVRGSIVIGMYIRSTASVPPPRFLFPRSPFPPPCLPLLFSFFLFPFPFSIPVPFPGTLRC